MSDKFSFDSAEALIALLKIAHSVLGDRSDKLMSLFRQLGTAFRDSGYSELLSSMQASNRSCMAIQEQLGEVIASMEKYKNRLAQLCDDECAPHSGVSTLPGSFSSKMSVSQNKEDACPSEHNPTVGWCPQNRMRAVHITADGTKGVVIMIAGDRQVYPCTLAGMEAAYDQAVLSGDPESIARISAMYEIEVLRDGLELNGGDPSFPQLGGYHGDVAPQDPPGFESHHIPARSVQNANVNNLPAISISTDDHKLTSSYAGKQNSVYQAVFPTNLFASKYKESIIEKIQQGGSGYVEAIRCELLDLRLQTGHRYDGGISAYLDAAMDMIATSGIPESSGER